MTDLKPFLMNAEGFTQPRMPKLCAPYDSVELYP